MSVPTRVREQVRDRLWGLADQLGWAYLSAPEKTRLYEDWTQSPDIGGVLSHYIDKARVRVYLKDTLLKSYTRARLADHARPVQLLGVDSSIKISMRFDKPHAVKLADGRIICWGKAEDWKTITTALFERAYFDRSASAFGAVFFGASGRWNDVQVRTMVEELASRLGITRVAWLSS